jgi:galactokinase
MYRIENGPPATPDTDDFFQKLNSLAQQSSGQSKLFDPEQEILVGRAPGRLDVMGGIADYSGSLVLQTTIREATHAAVQKDPSRKLTIVTLADEPGRETAVGIPLTELERDGVPTDYEYALSYFRQQDQTRQWAAYVAGVFLVLMRKRGFAFEQGARILIDSSVPEGKGVSSSAALEVSVMSATAAAFGIELHPSELASLCQIVENRVAGAPCGIMDQMTSVCGVRDNLFALLCQPAEIVANIPIPSDVAFWGLDSGERHAVSGADYGDVRAAAFMGYVMIAAEAGLSIHQEQRGRLTVDDPRWRGYLANISPIDFERTFASHLPETISGEEFLSRFSGSVDSVSQIKRERSYAIRVAASHPVYEHQRIRRFSELLIEQANNDRLELMGELMYQSHASYTACGLGSNGTDLLVELVREAGSVNGLYGARITGGGSGGTVSVLGRSDAGAAIKSVAERYATMTGHQPYIFSGSSPGAAEFGFLRLDARRR